MEEKKQIIIESNIRNRVEDVERVISIQHMLINENIKKLYIRFTTCEYLDAAVAVLLGTMPTYAKSIDKRVYYRFGESENLDQSSNNHTILDFMKKVGMYKFYMKNSIGYTGENAIPFDNIINEDMMDKYTNKIMDLAPIKMQPDAKDILASYIYEIYQNAFCHSQSHIGVFTSGAWMPANKEFSFSIYDMGIGIPKSIRVHKHVEWEGIECLKWAFIEGNTTVEEDVITRGLGLSTLEKFIRLNEGTMYVYTDDVLCIIDRNKPIQYQSLEKRIKGTLIIINIRADDNHIYIVA